LKYGLVDEKSRTVLQWYWEQSTLASKIMQALQIGWFLPIVIVGRSGFGKTSYAYYTLKTGIIEYLCADAKPKRTNMDDCIAYIEENYGELCMNKYCEKPDGLDKEYKWAFYTGITDLERFMKDAPELLAGDGSRRKILLLDDLVTTTMYSMGGRWRRIYMLFKEVIRVARRGASVVIATSVTPKLVPDIMRQGGEFISVRYVYRDNRWLFAYERLAKVSVPEKYGKYVRYVPVYQKLYADVVPFMAVFGLPRWLEREIDERKKQLIIDASRLALGGEDERR
jgi:hypothetical protein